MPEFHPVAGLFPLMEGEEFARLVEDIRQNGLHDRITLDADGRIVDGRNRYRACEVAGVEPLYEQWDGRGSLVAYVVSKNEKRRHLTPSQRAAIAVDILPLLEEEARERMSAAGRSAAPGRPAEKGTPKMDSAALVPNSKGEAVDQAAALLGVSGTYVAYARRLSKEAPEELALVREGKQSMNEAIEKVPPVLTRRKPRPRKPSPAEQIIADYTAAWSDLAAARQALSPTAAPAAWARFERAWDAFGELSGRVLDRTRKLDNYQRTWQIREMRRRREAGS